MSKVLEQGLCRILTRTEQGHHRISPGMDYKGSVFSQGSVSLES